MLNENKKEINSVRDKLVDLTNEISLLYDRLTSVSEADPTFDNGCDDLDTAIGYLQESAKALSDSTAGQ